MFQTTNQFINWGEYSPNSYDLILKWYLHN